MSAPHVHPDDRWTVEAKEKEKYWLCECGVARVKISNLFTHLEDEGHIAEKIHEESGTVIGIAAGGFENLKYNAGIPDSAQIKRSQKKNDPLFPHGPED